MYKYKYLLISVHITDVSCLVTEFTIKIKYQFFSKLGQDMDDQLYTYGIRYRWISNESSQQFGRQR